MDHWISKHNIFADKLQITDERNDELEKWIVYLSEAVARRCSVKKVFLEISQNPQENTCARVSFVKMLQA